MSQMPNPERESVLVALNAVTQVDEAGYLFIAPVIHDWQRLDGTESIL